MPTPEFVRLDGQVVRVTSLRTDEATGDVTLIIVARGTIARTQLADIASRPSLRFEVPDETPESTLYVRDAEVRSTGEFEQTMTRLRLELSAKPVQAPPAASTDQGESQLDRIERKLDDLLALLRNQA
jgi:hypothetical protein